VSLTLHYFPGNASLTPHMLLRELGAPFELQRVDRAANAQKSPAYLKLNPNGLIPVLQDGDLVLYETPAIVLHLLDTHPQAGLAPAVGTHERAEFYKWLMWLSGLQALAPHYFYPERLVAPGNTAGAAEVKAQVEARIAALIDQIDARLASQPWMGGERFSALDCYTFMLCRWTRGMQRPARTLPHIGPYLTRVLARPAVQQTLAAEGLQAPFV
jgi:glutathione S-transferase